MNQKKVALRDDFDSIGFGILECWSIGVLECWFSTLHLFITPPGILQQPLTKAFIDHSSE
jgi:hypothetical protein